MRIVGGIVDQGGFIKIQTFIDLSKILKSNASNKTLRKLVLLTIADNDAKIEDPENAIIYNITEMNYESSIITLKYDILSYSSKCGCLDIIKNYEYDFIRGQESKCIGDNFYGYVVKREITDIKKIYSKLLTKFRKEHESSRIQEKY